MKRLVAFFVVVVFLPVFFCVAAEKSKPIGSVNILTGSATIIRDGNVFPATLGQQLFENDTLQTGNDGGMGVIFRDDTMLSIGPNTVISVDEYAFSPKEGNLAMVLKMLKGIAAYVSGKIAELSPGSVRFETPEATVGIRGTKFFAKVEQESP